jgi:uncharacterized protein (DUF2267 family)
VDGPDRAVSTEAIEHELGSTLGLDAKGAHKVLLAICNAVADTVAPGQINEVRGQLPEDMKHVFAAR